MDPTKIEDAKEAVSDAVETVMEAQADIAEVETVEAAVERAEERAEAAEAVAESIADAVVESEMVRRITAAEEKVLEWLGENGRAESLLNRLSSQEVTLEEHSRRIAELQARLDTPLPPILVPAEPSTSTLPISEGTTEITAVDPTSVEEPVLGDVVDPPVAVTAVRKKRGLRLL